MTLEEVEVEVARLRQVWGILGPYRFLRGRDDWGAAHIEGAQEPFDVVVTERGRELERRTVSGSELVFEAVSNTARGLAFQRELETRQDDYSRKTWMDGHVRLIAMVSQDWAGRVREEYEVVLRRSPLQKDEVLGARQLDLSDYGCVS